MKNVSVGSRQIVKVTPLKSGLDSELITSKEESEGTFHILNENGTNLFLLNLIIN